MKILVLSLSVALSLAVSPAMRAAGVAEASIVRHAAAQGSTQSTSVEADTSCKFGCWG